jgi:pimeloyl-ACP methyl ester carboxylesterase
MTFKKSTLQSMQKNIKPLNMNGLNGRMLKLPALSSLKSKREILLVYGHHASIERMYGIAEVLNEFGTVTMPDLPGCGGMDSYYKIGIKPSLDSMADYLASFIKLTYRGKKVSIAGMSLGFAIVTRMLQKYPELVNKVDMLVSIVGFSHKYDFSFKKSRINYYKNGARFFSRKLPSLFFYNVFLHPSLIRSAYSKTHNAKKKLSHLNKEDKKAAIEFEVNLWRQDDIRTYMDMVVAMLTIDNCKQQINLPVHHISVSTDQYFDHTVVEQHMRIIFNDFIEHEAIIPNHAPSIIATKKEAEPFIPKSIKKLLLEPNKK